MVKNSSLFWIVTVSIVALDQISKILIHYFQPTSTFFHLVQNTGAGFGILKGQTILLAVISLVVALAVILNYKKISHSPFPQCLWGLFLGGVVGNLIDRALRGYVIDFIDLQVWPAFNVADAAISVSVMGLIWWHWKS